MTKSAVGSLQLVRRLVVDRHLRELPDHELLHRFTADRDEEAFAALLERHGAMVLGVCRTVLRNEGDAEDAFQATFLVLAKGAANIRKGTAVGSFLHGVAYRIALKAQAQAARRQKHETRAAAQTQPPAPEDLTWREVQLALHAELNRLPESHREPVVLCYLEGKTQDEAAALLRVSRATVKKRLECARSLLRLRLARRGLGSAAVLAVAVCPGTASATVPLSLADPTIRAAHLLAADQAVTSVISPAVNALTNGALKTMFANRFKVVLAVSVALTAIGLGGVLYLFAAAGAQPIKTSTAEPRVLQLEARGRRVAWSPDGKTLAVVTKNESLFTRKGSAIQLWDTEKGKVRATLAQSAEGGLAFQHVTFSPDGKTVAATVSEQVILPNALQIRSVAKVWDAQTLALQQTLGNNDSQMVHVTFSPDGKRVATCDPTNKEVKLWSAQTGALERTLDTGKAQPWSAAFSPEGKLLAVGEQNGDGSGEVALWDTGQGKQKHKLALERFTTSVAFSPDGKLLASGHGGGKVHVLGVEKGDSVALLKGDEHALRSVTFVSDRVVAAGRSDGTVLLWDARTGEREGSLAGHRAEVYSIACSADGKTLASVSQDETLRLWPINFQSKAEKGRPTAPPKAEKP
jgi:RNA polymerase sigma factor (sigma-70 family)